MPTMNKVKHIKANSSLKKFVTHVNQDIDRLNVLIDIYNKSTPGERIDSLKAIFDQKLLIENKYSDRSVSQCPSYVAEIQDKLFLSIQQEFAINGLQMDDATIQPEATNSFSKLLVKMEPEKVNQLIAILSAGAAFDRNALASLYPNGSNAEFDEFLMNNGITYLGGSNSKNFKISPYDGSKPYVLKVENRMGSCKLPVVHLRKGALQDTLTTVMAERPGTIQQKEGVITRTLLTTELCSGGDLMAHSKKQGLNSTLRSEKAINIYSQMNDVLLAISDAGCAFPDMKNANWLIDEHDKVLLADTKAFVFSDNGLLDFTTLKKNGSALLSTQYINPPEFRKELYEGRSISVDKMQAFMLGKNLYEYVSQCDALDLYGKNDASQLKFNQIIFKTDKGKALKSLIEDLVKEDPANRISLEDARLRLSHIEQMAETNPIQHEELKQNNLNTLELIRRYNFGEKDVKMNEFIQQKEDLIMKTNDPSLLREIQKDLQNILKQQAPGVQAYAVAQNLRNNAGTFTVGMNAKADRIEQAMCNIPVEERGKINDKNYAPGRQVHLEVASHRHFGSWRKVKLDENNEIDEKTAAKSYKQFKEALNVIKSQEADKEPEAVSQINLGH